MSLDFQLVNVEFTEGLDTSTNRKLKVAGKWTEADNVAFVDTVAAPGTQPSNESVSIRDSVSVIDATLDGNSLATYNDELLVINGSDAKTVSTSGKGLASAGQVGFLGVAKTPLLRGEGCQDSHDTATLTTVGGVQYVCHVWRNYDIPTGGVTSVACTLIDEATGAQLISNFTLRSGGGMWSPRVVGLGSGFLLLYYDANQLFGRFIDTTIATPAMGTEVSLINSASLNQRGAGFDARRFDGTDNAFIAYPWNDGVTSVRVSNVAVVATVPSISVTTNVTTQAQVNNAAISGVAVGQSTSGTRMLVAISATAGGALGGGVIAATTDTALAVQSGPLQVDSTVNPTAGPTHITACTYSTTKYGDGWLIFVDQVSNYNTARLNQIRSVLVTTVLGVSVAAAALCNSNSFRVNAAEASGVQGPWIAGKAFVVSQKEAVFLPVATLSSYGAVNANVVQLNSQNTLLMLDGITGRSVSRAMVGNYGTGTFGAFPNIIGYTINTPGTAPPLSTQAFALAAPERLDLQLIGTEFGTINTSPTGIARLTLTPSFEDSLADAQLGPSTYIAGGALTNYDGSNAFEHGFNAFPEGMSAVANAAGGTVTAGVHQVVALYEWVDTQGQRHQSIPSEAVSVTTAGATASIDILIPTLQVTQKSSVKLVIYMTAAAGLTFYRVGLNGAVIASVDNTKAATTVGFKATEADAALIQNELMYTQPNQAATTLPNEPPPPSSTICVHQGRLFSDATDAPFTYAYSQQQVMGVGLQWSSALGGTIDVSSGGIVGLCELDEKVIFFGAKRLFAVVGSGPNAAGGFDNYSEPTPIETDVGCSDRRSILRMPFGIIFKATKGWHLLSRDLSVKYIGDGVEAYNGYDVTSAVLMEDRKECRFTVVTDVEDIYARVLVFAYGRGQWSTFSFGTSGGYPINDAAWWGARYKSNGFGYVSLSDSDGLNGDAAAGQLDNIGAQGPQVVQKTLQTSYLKVNSLTGFQRVRWLYMSLTQLVYSAPSGTLTVTVYFDDDTTGTAKGSYSFTIALSSLAGLTNTTDSLDFRHKLRRQKCKNVSFRIVETPDSVVLNPLSGLQVLGLQVGLKQGTNKLPSGQTVA